jgi:hypothetical protein
MTGRRDPTYLGVVFDIAKAQQQKPAIQKLTKESFLKGSDEFKLEEVIAEFERKTHLSLLGKTLLLISE